MNTIDEKKACPILYYNNYINVISPFKYKFAKKDKFGNLEKTGNNHIYEVKTEFSVYYNLFRNERDNYPKIFSKLLDFEVKVNSVLSYEILNFYHLSSEEDFIDFIKSLRHNLDKNRYITSNKIKDHMSLFIDSLEKGIYKYQSPYLLFDRLSLNETLSLMMNIDENELYTIVQTIVANQNIIKANDILTFYKQSVKLVQIRNCVCHGNSLEILKRYYSVKDNKLRVSSDKKAFAKIIDKLIG